MSTAAKGAAARRMQPEKDIPPKGSDGGGSGCLGSRSIAC